MPYINVDIDIDIDEFLQSCSRWEIKDVIRYLKSNNFISEDNQDVFNLKPLSPTEQEFETALRKLHNRWNMLSHEDEEKILTIAKKLP